MTYPGGKNGAGVFQTIINLMPPHQVYIEPFLGSGAIMRLKRPAGVNIGIDLDSAALATFNDASGGIVTSGDAGQLIAESDVAGSHRQKRRAGPAPHAKSGDASDRERFRFLKNDALEFLSNYKFSGQELVYCDPPYMHETRNRKDLYQFEMTDEQHVRLLQIIRDLPRGVKIMISGYWTKLYARELAGWNSTTYQAVTRSGRMATEWLWFNFPEPVMLHDYRYLGRDFRQREQLKRKSSRWMDSLRKIPELERNAFVAEMKLCLAGNFRERERIKRKMLRWTNRLRTMTIVERRAMMQALDLTSQIQAG